MITAVFRVKRTAKGMTVHAEFTGHGPRGRKRVQKKRFRDAYGSAKNKLRHWIEDWEKSCKEDGIPTQYSIEFQPMACPHDNISLPSTSDPQIVCADCGQVLEPWEVKVCEPCQIPKKSADDR